MMKLFALYSITRRVMYLHEEDHKSFWSKYLQYKYPKDRWVLTDTDHVSYHSLMQNHYVNASTTRLYDDTDTAGRKLNLELRAARDELALEALTARISPAADLFIVYKSGMGQQEPILIYAGFDLKLAINMYMSTPGAEHVDVYRDGLCVDTIYSEIQYNPYLRTEEQAQKVK